MVNKIFRRRVLEINGHKCLSKTLLYGLDGLRPVHMVQWRSFTDRLGAICEMLAAFTLGKDSVDDYVEHLFAQYKVDLPVDKTYPGGIFEMLGDTRFEPVGSLEQVLVRCEKRSDISCQEDDKEREIAEKYIRITNEIVSAMPSFISENDMKFLLGLQNRKKAYAADGAIAEYVQDAAVATHIWCSLLTEIATNPEGTVFSTVLAILDGGYCEEDDIETLLNKNGWEHDWEWYSEDFTACQNELTIIPPSELLEVCKSNFEKSLGLNRRYLTDYPIDPVYSDKSR